MNTESRKLIEEFRNRRYQTFEKNDSSETANEQSKRNIIYRAMDRMSEFSLKHPTATDAILITTLIGSVATGAIIGQSLTGNAKIHIPAMIKPAYDIPDPTGLLIGCAAGGVSWHSVLSVIDYISEKIKK